MVTVDGLSLVSDPMKISDATMELALDLAMLASLHILASWWRDLKTICGQ